MMLRVGLENFTFKVLGLVLVVAVGQSGFANEVAGDSRGKICKYLLAGGEEAVAEWRQLEAGAPRSSDGISAPELNLRDENGSQFRTPYNRQNFLEGELTHVGYHMLGRDIEFTVQGVTYRAVVIKEADSEFKSITVRPYAMLTGLPDQPPLPLDPRQNPDLLVWEWIALEDQHDWSLPLSDMKRRDQLPRYVSLADRRELDVHFRLNRVGVDASEPIRNTTLAERMYLYRVDSFTEGDEINELNNRITFLIRSAQQGTSLQEFEADRRVLDLQNALLRGDYQGVAARVRETIVETWRVVHEIRKDLVDLAEEGYEREEALELVMAFEDYQGVPEAFRASDFFAGLEADEKATHDLMLLFSRFFAHQKQLGEMIQSYDIVWAIFNRLLNDSSIPVETRGDLDKALEEARFGFAAVPPTHREILYHAQTHVVEEARLTKNKKLEASRKRQTIFDRVRSSLQTIDPKLLPAPKYTRGAWAFLTKQMINDLHHNILRSEIIFMRLTAGNLSNYPQEVARNADTAILPIDEDAENPQMDAHLIDPGASFDLRPMDYHLFDTLYDRVGVYGTIDPLVAFYRQADTDRVLNDLRIRFDKIAEGRSKSVQDKIEKAKTVAAGMAPLSMSYEPYDGWWTATRVGWAIVGAAGVGATTAFAYFGIWDVSASWDSTSNFLGELPENTSYYWQWVNDQFVSQGYDPADVQKAIEDAQRGVAAGEEMKCPEQIAPLCP
ncbi:MAG: hypothetical protein AAF202_01640 [Pseudomonadota bacterium]